MGIIEIINIIMAILAFISGLFSPKTGVRQVAYVSDFACSEVGWSVPPVVSGGEFRGTAEVRCTFEGKNGGGLLGLRAHFVNQLPQDAQVHGEPLVVSYQGLPSLEYDTTLDMGNGIKAHGSTQIATNGFTVLRNIFQSRSIAATGNGRLLQSVYAEYEVRPTSERDVYEVRAIQSIRVKKPLFVWASTFRDSLKEQSEESLLGRAVGAVQEMASHL